MTSAILKIASWTLRIAAAAILGQTLVFKFAGAEESVYIFSTLGMEPWGRIGVGIAELAAAAMLLVPRTVVFGAGLTLSIMSVALVSHLRVLGIEVHGDGGLLFGLAVGLTVMSVILLVLHRDDVRARTAVARALLLHAVTRPALPPETESD